MRPRDRELANQLSEGLLAYHEKTMPLRGILDPQARATLIEQLLESVHRVAYVSVISERPLSQRRTDPDDEIFDPLKAAILHQRRGDIDEAFWLVFLFVHFGRHAKARWRYAREVYGRLGSGARWDWATVHVDPMGFRSWLDAHNDALKREGIPGGFGNHRKYQSLDAYSATGTGAAVESYVNWVNPPRTHAELVEEACDLAGGDPRQAFDQLYRSMNDVVSFGRTARFDYLTMVGKLRLAPIEPGFTYMENSTGPIEGARLLFGSRKQLTAKNLEELLIELDVELKVGMQVLEDSLCNWQKSPRKLLRFRG